MAAKKQIILNAFNMNCVGHINHGLWTHPRDRSAQFDTLEYWIELVQLLERGLFDSLFLADIVGVYDVYQGSVELPLRESIQLPVNDPLVLVSALAAATRHLGFGVTVNLSYEPPYLFARRMSTLDHLSRGRVAWNIVTGYLDSGARAMGLPAQIEHDRRYDRADEYLELLYKLWEGSWEDGAVLKDRQRRGFADPARVHPIRHHGEFFHAEGYHLCAPSPQRTPVLYQAGSSERGLRFAGRHAECVFINARDHESARRQIAQIRGHAREAGRDPAAVKVVMGVNVVVAPTEAEALEKYREYCRYANPEAGLAHFSSSVGVDFSRYGLDESIRIERSNGIQSVAKTFSGWTKRALLEQHALGGRYVTVVGSPAQVADALEAWIAETDLDGFNLTRTVTPESYADFIELVVPELQDRGAYKTRYAEGTLREKLFGTGPRLPDSHPAAAWRPQAPRRAAAG